MAAHVGRDAHKRFCQAASMNEDGKIAIETRFENTLNGAMSLINLARSYDSNTKAVVEP
jgi:hypothetical protein